MDKETGRSKRSGRDYGLKRMRETGYKGSIVYWVGNERTRRNVVASLKAASELAGEGDMTCFFYSFSMDKEKLFELVSEKYQTNLKLVHLIEEAGLDVEDILEAMTERLKTDSDIFCVIDNVALLSSRNGNQSITRMEENAIVLKKLETFAEQNSVKFLCNVLVPGYAKKKGEMLQELRGYAPAEMWCDKEIEFFEESTFSISLLKSEAFWKKVLYVEKWRASGLGGPGALWIITDEKLLYQIGGEKFQLDEKQLDAFAKFCAYGENIWIRKEYAEAFEASYEEARKGTDYIFRPNLFAKLLGINGEIERVVEEELAEVIEKNNRDCEAQRKEYERETIKANMFLWKPLYMNNMQEMPQIGEYALLFRKTESQIRGYKFSVIYQMPEEEPLGIKAGAVPELFLLYVKEYEEIVGPYEYPNVDYDRTMEEMESENTFTSLDMNHPGEFVRAFQTMKEAKEYVGAFATRRYQITRKNQFIP